MATGSPTASAAIQPNPLHESPGPNAHDTVTLPVAVAGPEKPESFRDVTPEAKQSPYSSLQTHNRKLKLESFKDAVVPMPQTAHEAEELLHYLRSHRATCASEKELAYRQLHQALLYVQFVRSRIDIASQKIMTADGDIGTVRAALRTNVPGAQLGVYHCTSCFGKKHCPSCFGKND
ncbi:hypothetical protein GGX14DRAFT_562213 [Mycena pura]|uniref:Uncharacterized protein n=1 Tax=Mycena pura TaxID=153505 RepID=A0AAD6VN87_9AGAR|nr:hypothetical protein GGX14DRAFT_562213 [Mycena pura]